MESVISLLEPRLFEVTIGVLYANAEQWEKKRKHILLPKLQSLTLFEEVFRAIYDRAIQPSRES